MAGIEKICEFSDEYPGWEMYGYKRNSIQIMPKFRKLFRGAKATLVIKKAEINEVSFMSRNGYCYSSPCEYELADYFDYDVTTYMEYQRARGERFIVFYDYVLVVEDEHLKGTVRGKYFNSSMKISTVRRKLKRMIGKNLRIVNEAGTRGEIFAAWRKEFVAAARAYDERETHRLAMKGKAEQEAAEREAAEPAELDPTPEEMALFKDRVEMVEAIVNELA